MSRIGKQPVVVPSGVTVTVNKDNQLIVKGPKGELKQEVSPITLIRKVTFGCQIRGLLAVVWLIVEISLLPTRVTLRSIKQNTTA